MKIWIIKAGEPLPRDLVAPVRWRAGFLSYLLHNRGHEVTYWASTFDHMTKTISGSNGEQKVLGKWYKIIFLHGISYYKNVSFRRIINNIQVAFNFRKFSKLEEKPNIILCSWPTVDLACIAVRYGKKHNIPVILDIRDLWPDIFVDALPAYLKFAGKLAIWPLDIQAKYALNNATHITGISPGIVDWGLRKKGNRKSYDASPYFTLGFQNKMPDSDALKSAKSYWDNKGITDMGDQFVLCYMGSLTKFTEVRTLVRAAELLCKNKQDNIKIVICGIGSEYNELQAISEKLPNLLLTGWVEYHQIWELLQRSSLGVIPYPSTKDMKLSFPNKVGEYLSAGLPILSSIDGELKKYLEENKCGMTYQNNNEENLTECILAYSANSAMYAEHKENATKAYHDHFEGYNVYEKYCDYLEKRSNCNKEECGI